MIITLPFPTLHILPIEGGDGIWLDSMDSFDPVESTDTEYRPNAAGSMRAFEPAFDRRSFAVGCTYAPTSEARWIKAHRKQHCLFRFDDVRLFGMYEMARVAPYQVGDLYRIEFTVTEVGYSEAV